MELIQTRCKQGKLIITDTDIRVELNMLGTYNESVLPRDVFTSLECRTVVPSVFGLGGGANLIFHGRGAERLKADMVPMKKAQKIVAILNGRG